MRKINNIDMDSVKIGDLSLRVPIIQGGMGVGISLSGLASAVANEGGVGVISSAGLGLIYYNFSNNYMKSMCVSRWDIWKQFAVISFLF